MAGEHTEAVRLIEKIGDSFDDYKKYNDERLERIEKGLPTGDLDEKLDRIDNDLSGWGEAKRQFEVEIENQAERIADLEALKDGRGFTLEEKQDDAHLDEFVKWMRARGQLPNNQALVEAEGKSFSLFEGKTVTIGTPAAGGYAVPKVIQREIERLEKKFSPVRNDVRVRPVSTSDYKELVNIRGFTGGWVGESGNRTGTNTPQLREITPTHGELYAYPESSEWALDDVFFNVAQWLAEEAAQEFAILEGDAVIRGDGSNKPTGMLNSPPTPVTDETGTRGAAVYESVPVTGGAAATGTKITFDDIYSVIYQTNSIYRAAGKFLMSSVVTGKVRKLKNSQGDYLWQPNNMVGQPATLAGYPISTWEQMPDEAAASGTTFPVAFGDIQRGYVLTDRIGIRITTDQVTNIGFVKWYIRRREGGHPLNNNAIKFLSSVFT